MPFAFGRAAEGSLPKNREKVTCLPAQMKGHCEIFLLPHTLATTPTASLSTTKVVGMFYISKLDQSFFDKPFFTKEIQSIH